MTRALAFDSSVLSAFARARRLDILGRLTDGRRRVVTRAVLQEVDRGRADYPHLADVHRLPWLAVVAIESLEELVVFNHYVRVLGSDARNVGESSILAWAEISGAVAVVDDRDAVSAAKARGVHVRRSLALVREGLVQEMLTMDAARLLVDDLIINGGARLPCDGAGLESWLERNGLLPH